MQPDTLIPDLSNPQTLNRYSYVGNNPISYNDPSGHCLTGLVIDTLVCADVVISVVALTLVTYAAIILIRETPQGQRLKSQADAAISKSIETKK